MRNDAARAAAVVRIEAAAARCTARATSGHGKKARHGDDDKGHGKAKGSRQGEGLREEAGQVPAKRRLSPSV